ncbi:hypothetical protein [Acidocella aminolytica]|uniref:Uncharacterized protein n=1 Tax=Acidocella aminolytica 101 = DSM 11237 TaxID=1120923 RepID=A0A0D6PGP6_9PROT|nr:hypothetical protein [Acidocella aminolytica]GAN80551.1 hypothetical protein Aam_051_015 [Acidocella aminolytica 101 = DSM 11237]SHE29050.1 hypothetical protein SAMN02746095_00018 [Acidocella aminolytica 101 = DSM 11237]
MAVVDGMSLRFSTIDAGLNGVPKAALPLANLWTFEQIMGEDLWSGS